MSTLRITGTDAILAMDDDRRMLAGQDKLVTGGEVTSVDLPCLSSCRTGIVLAGTGGQVIDIN